MEAKHFNDLSIEELINLKNSTEKIMDHSLNTIGQLQVVYNSQKNIVQKSEVITKGKNLLLD